MTNQVIDALAALIEAALPWRKFLNLDAPAPYTDPALADMIQSDADAA